METRHVIFGMVRGGIGVEHLRMHCLGHFMNRHEIARLHMTVLVVHVVQR